MATIVPVSLGGTGSNNISGAIENLGFSAANTETTLSNVTATTVTIQGLTLNESTGVPSFINSNLHMGAGTRINGTPVLDSAVINNATISAGGLTFITENGNALVTTARVIHKAAFDSNTSFPDPVTFNGYFAVDHAYSKAYYSDGYKHNELLTNNTSLTPDKNFGTYEQDFDIAGGATVLRSFLDIGTITNQIRNVNMHGAIRGANTLSVYESVNFGDNGFRYVANDSLGDQIIIGPGGAVPDTQMQINGNLRINGNLVIIGATLNQDTAAGTVQTNLHHFASTTNTTTNSLIYGVDSANTNIDTVQGNLHSFGTHANSRINIVQSNVHSMGARTNANINVLQGNMDHLGTSVNNSITAIHSGSQDFTVNKTFQANVTIQGNLVVQGDTISADVTNMTVEDPLIVLANNNPGTSLDAGLLVQRLNPADNQAWIWDEANDGWAALRTSEDGSTAGSISALGYMDVYARDVRPQRDLRSPNVFVTDLSADRIVHTTTSGELTATSSLTFDGTTFGVNKISSVASGDDLVFDTNGTGNVVVTQGTQIELASANVADLTSGRVVYAGSNGELQDDGDFTFDGTTVTASSLSVSGSTASTSKDTGALIVTNGGLGVEGAIHAGGDVSAFNTSDYRLKNNVKNINSALDKLDNISGVEFDWSASEAGLNYGHLHGHDVGVIAQDLQQILPEAVKTRDDGYLAVDYSRVVPLLIQAIKELKAQIEDK